MNYAKIAKSGLLIGAWLGAQVVFAVACRLIYHAYPALWTGGKILTTTALWVVAGVALVALTSGLLAALVRPWWLIAAAAGAAALLLIVIWGPGTHSALAAAFYWAVFTGYARAVMIELDNRVTFTVQPMADEYKSLRGAIALLLAASLVLAYWQAARRDGYLVPPAAKETIHTKIRPLLKAELEKQFQLTEAQKKAALAQFDQAYNRLWDNLERTLAPHADLVPWGLGIVLAWQITAILPLVDLIPFALLTVLFPLLKAVGFTREVIEVQNVRRLTLD